MSHRAPDVVVVGGPNYGPDHNATPNVMVRELCRHHRVLYLHSEANGSLVRRLGGIVHHLGARQVGRILLDRTRVRRVEERLWLASVRGLPSLGPLWAPESMRRRNARVLSRVIRSWLAETGADPPLLIFYWWALPELIDTVPHSAAVYDCTDDHAALPGSFAGDIRVQRLEGRLLDAVDRAYVVSPQLLASRQRPGRSVALLPVCVDMTLFASLERDGFAVPDDLSALPRPIIGYAGALGMRMDWELLGELTRRCQEWSFVFLGGHRRDLPAHMLRPNVFCVAPMPYRAALAAMSAFDVATIPMMANRFSMTNSFLKLREYLAHGHPVVSAALPDTESLAAQAPGLLRLARGPDEWVCALEEALQEPRDSPLRAARRAYVEERSTPQRVAALLGDVYDTGPRPVVLQS